MSENEVPSSIQTISFMKEAFWEFLELPDILNLSVCSKNSASLIIQQPALNQVIRKTPLALLGRFQLFFPAELTIGLFRRILNRLNTSVEAVVTIDDRKGRVTLDIGSAFHDNDTYLAEATTVPSGSSVRRIASFHGAQDLVNPEEEDEDHPEIFKQFELISFDEYDDFKPRHPLPKDRAHRRDHSYFNSDIEMVVGEIGAMDLASIAAKAALIADDDMPNNDQNKSGLSAADKPPLPPKQSAKDRILSKTKNFIPGRTKVTKVTQRDDDDDDDDENN
jgi:hypothetical protein